MNCRRIVGLLLTILVCRADDVRCQDTTTSPYMVLVEKPQSVQTRVANRIARGSAVSVKTAQFTVTYNGNPPAQVQQAFTAALNVWGGYIDSTIPIRIDMTWGPLTSPAIGSAKAAKIVRNFSNAPLLNVWYPCSLADKFAGSDLHPSDPDIRCTFSSTAPWYFGIDGNTPPNQLDFMSVILHEVGHGLGFFGSATVDANGNGAWGFGTQFPARYDRDVYNGAGQSIINTSLFPNPSQALLQQYQSNNLFLRDNLTGYSAPAYAPAAFQQGSSFSHLDEAVFPVGDPNSLMTPGIARGESIHDPGPIVLNTFRNHGWLTTEIPLLTTNTNLGVLRCYGRAGKCYRADLATQWSAVITGTNLAITTAAGTTSNYSAMQPGSYYSANPAGYVSFRVGSGFIEAVEIGDLTSDTAYITEGLIASYPYVSTLVSEGVPVLASNRFEHIQLGTEITSTLLKDGKKKARLEALNEYLSVTTQNSGTLAGEMTVTTGTGNITIHVKKPGSNGGIVEAYVNGTLIMSDTGDPHILIPAQEAMFQQADNEVIFILPDQRTAVRVESLDVPDKSSRVIARAEVFDTQSPGSVHVMSGLNGQSVAAYTVITNQGVPVPSDLWYESRLKGKSGDLTFLTSSGRMLGYSSFADRILDYETHMRDRCARQAFNQIMVQWINNNLGGNFVGYYIEDPGLADGSPESWMQWHVDLLKEQLSTWQNVQYAPPAGTTKAAK